MFLRCSPLPMKTRSVVHSLPWSKHCHHRWPGGMGHRYWPRELWNLGGKEPQLWQFIPSWHFWVSTVLKLFPHTHFWSHLCISLSFLFLKSLGFWLHFSIHGPLGQFHLLQDINHSKIMMSKSLFPAKSLSSEFQIQKSKCFMAIPEHRTGPHIYHI